MAIISNPPTKAKDYFCSIASQEVNEQLFGTAPQVQTWVLLEFNEKWGYKAFAESGISEKVKAHLNSQLENIPLSRLLLIKQHNKLQDSAIAFYVAFVNESNSALYKFNFNQYEDLLNFDLNLLLKDGKEYENNLSSDPIFLVCTNGLRDKCCAKYGLAIYNDLKYEYGQSMWQSTHHGGHRFAPNLLCLPHGLSYGRLQSNNVDEVLRKYSRSQIHLPNLRGRSEYPQHVQAAEVLMRQHLGNENISSHRFTSVEQIDKNEWKINFAIETGDVIYNIHLAIQSTGTHNQASCIGEKQVEISEFQLVDQITRRNK